MTIEFNAASSLKEKPPENALGFGTYFTDHLFVMDYETSKGWFNPRIEPYHSFPFDPSMMTLHYGQSIFEGIKAYKRADGSLGVFRPKDYLQRLNRSAEMLCIPTVDTKLVYEGLMKLLSIEKDWIPSVEGTSLYIRPFIFATDPYLGVRPSSTYKLMIILSPVGAYYPEGFKPVKILVEDKYVRAIRGGLGAAKTPANYASSLKAAEEAKKKGYTQVLWLDGIEQKYIEEVGTMNIFFVIDDEVVTPTLEVGSILDGMTRRSVITACKDWGLKVSERRISIQEVFQAQQEGRLKEIFGTGTAAVISPVSELRWKDQSFVLGNGESGEISSKLYNYITGVQYGKVEDKFDWVDQIEE